MEIPSVIEDHSLSAFAFPAVGHMGYSGLSLCLSLSRKPLKADNKVVQQEFHGISSLQASVAHRKVQEPQSHAEE